MILVGGAIDLALATFAASLLGSMHCVGMCGPFVLLATDVGKKSTSTENVIARSRFSLASPLIYYHAGRLITYLTLGLVVGYAATRLNDSGFVSNLGMMVGAGFLVFGFARLWFQLLPNRSSRDRLSDIPWHAPWVQAWSKQLSRIRRILPRSSRSWSAFGWGLTTTLLPCGWLYLFLAMAIAAPSMSMSVGTMVAFWLGTLPALSITAWGWKRLGNHAKRLAGPLASACILGMGIYLVASRSSLDFSRILEKRSDAFEWSADQETGASRLERLRQELNAGLPCCKQASVLNAQPSIEATK